MFTNMKGIENKKEVFDCRQKTVEGIIDIDCCLF